MIYIKLIALFLIYSFLEPTRACGVPAVTPNINLFKRIINGQDAVANSWPWTVSIRFYYSYSLYDHFCTGTLIAADLVLTAASCVYNKNPANIVVLVGMHDRNAISSNNVAFVKGFAYNSGFNINSLPNGNDIAVLKLRNPVTLRNNVQIACLPANSNDFLSLINKKLVTVGWGSTNGINSNAFYSRFLQQTTLTLLNSNNPECTIIPYNKFSLFCAKDFQRSSNICFADAGAPLMAQINGRWHVYGIASMAFTYNNICVNTKPSYFTSVPNFLTWIQYWSTQI